MELPAAKKWIESYSRDVIRLPDGLAFHSFWFRFLSNKYLRLTLLHLNQQRRHTNTTGGPGMVVFSEQKNSREYVKRQERQFLS